MNAIMQNKCASDTDTTCPYCGVGCGVTVSRNRDNIIEVSGSKTHPANLGRLCVKGSALDETIDYKGRLLYPAINHQKVSWEAATSFIAEKFKNIITEHGPDAVALYLSGQILTEDYYVANKLMKGFIGSSNIDTNSRLCMASAVVAHKRAFGSDTVPGCYEDIELADLVVLTGSNLAWAHPILYQRLSAAKQSRPEMKVVVIDPRETATCDIADLHLKLKPGSDAFIFNGLLNHLSQTGCCDQTFISEHTTGLEDALKAATSHSLNDTARVCDIDATDLDTFYQWFSDTEKVVTLFSQGINQSSTGVDKGNAIINCHLMTGRIGKPGSTVFSMTGQPNAMGGREVGGLANQLAAHMDFNSEESIRLVEEFWQAENMAQTNGLKAVDMIDAMLDGKIKAVWIMATNPVVSIPDSERVIAALNKCDLVVVSDAVTHTDTLACADVILPASTWGEKSGTVTNSERYISRQKSFMAAPGEAKHDWQALCEVAQKLGFKEAFAYGSSADIFREHAALSGYKNNGSRDFDISGLESISDKAYDQLTPIQWPINEQYPTGRQRFFDDGRFYTPDRKARFIPINPLPPAKSANDQQLIMNTGRIRDQWHTMTRTGKTHRLMEHISTPSIEISSVRASDHDLQSGDIASLHRENSKVPYIARVDVTQKVRDDSVFVPMHWSRSFASQARSNALVNPVRDELSGQPEFKHSPVSIRKEHPNWQAQLVTVDSLQLRDDTHWFKVPMQQHQLWEVIQLDEISPKDWLFNQLSDVEDWVELVDSSNTFYSAAGFKANTLVALFISGRELPSIDSSWCAEQIGQVFNSDYTRLSLLAGQSSKGENTGRTICSCFQVGEKTIIDKIQEVPGISSEEVSAALKCGTNCGSCIPEVKALVSEHAAV